MNFYKTIPTLKLLIALAIFSDLSFQAIAQQSPREKSDSVITNGLDGKPLNHYADLKLSVPGFPKTNFVSAKTPAGDTLKKPAFYDQFQARLNAYDNLFRDINSDMKKKLETPFSLTEGSVSLLGMSGNMNNDSLKQNNYNLFDVNIGGAIVGIPFSALYQNHYYPFIQEGNMDRISFRYDKDNYLDGIKKKLAGKFNPEDFLQNIGDPVELLKATATKALSSELNNLRERYKGLLDDKLIQLGDPGDLFSKDIATLHQSLVNNKWIEQLRANSAMLAQLQNKINTGQPVDMQQFTLLKNELAKYKGTQELITIVETHNKKWQESGLLKRIKESGLIKKDMVQKVLNDPAILKKLAKQKLDLNGIQRLFLSVTKLNAGQSTADLSRLLTGNSLLHGINTGFQLNSKKAIDLMAGKLKTFNSVLDLPFTNSVFNNNNRMFGFSLQNKATNGSNGSVSLLAYQTFAGEQFPVSVAALPRNTMVIGINKQIEVNRTNNIQVELSKSSAYYMNAVSADSGSGRHNNTNNLFNTQDFGKSIAATVNYNGEFENINLQVESFIRYAGINYDNPASGFVPAGTKEAGAGIRKSFLEKKLQVYARTNLRQYKFSELSDNKFRSSNHFIDVKWRMKKGQSVSLRYQPVRSVRIANGIKFINASTERLAANATIAAKIRSLHYRNYITLAYQKNMYGNQNAGNASNKSLQFSSMQSFVVGKHVLYSNTSFNKVDNASAFIFFNTAFNTDLGITYSIGKNLSASSSVNYNSIQGWYQQIAVKQSLSGELSKKIKMDIYVDIGQNIKVSQPLPYSLYRAEWSIHYMFNR